MAGPMTKEHTSSEKARRARLSLARLFLGRWALTLALCGVVSLASQPVQAQDYAAAGQHFDAAQEAFAAGKFELAAREYQAAFDITKESTLLQSIGESWQRAGNQVKALASYKAYLQASPQAPDRVAIEERIKAIEAAQAEAAKPAQPPVVAGQPSVVPGQPPVVPGQPPVVPGQPPVVAGQPPVVAGQPSVVAGQPSAVPGQPPVVTGQPSVVAGQPAVVPGQPAVVPGQPAVVAGQPPVVAGQPPVVPAQPAAVETAPPITPPEPPPSKLRVAGWISVASAVALVTGGAVIGLGAQSRADEIRRRTTLVTGDQPLVYTDSEREAYTTLQSEGKSYNTAAIALFAVGGVAAATAITLFIVDFVRKPKAEPHKQVLMLPTLGPGTVGLSLVGGL